jgi:hypothetical protein
MCLLQLPKILTVKEAFIIWFPVIHSEWSLKLPEVLINVNMDHKKRKSVRGESLKVDILLLNYSVSQLTFKNKGNKYASFSTCPRNARFTA